MKVALKLNSSQDGQVFYTDDICQTLSAGHGNVPKILINKINGGGGYDKTSKRN